MCDDSVHISAKNTYSIDQLCSQEGTSQMHDWWLSLHVQTVQDRQHEAALQCRPQTISCQQRDHREVSCTERRWRPRLFSILIFLWAQSLVKLVNVSMSSYRLTWLVNVKLSTDLVVQDMKMPTVCLFAFVCEYPQHDAFVH